VPPGRRDLGRRRHPVLDDQGWLYFAGVIDLYPRRVVGWAMSNLPDADLVIDAFLMGFERRRPDGKLVRH
jgi:transposase InsO family protein